MSTVNGCFEVCASVAMALKATAMERCGHWASSMPKIINCPVNREISPKPSTNSGPTPSGSLPTDNDLFISISRGLVFEQDMPAFKFLPERDRWAVVAYIKSFSDRWEEEAEWQEDPIEVSEPPIPDSAMIEEGEKVYALMQCEQCHGPTGKGDGPSAPGLEDDSGLPIIPRDFTDASQFVGSSEPKGIYQTFTTGLDGTPMPSFADFLDEDQRWQLVWYVISLRPEFNLESTQSQMMSQDIKMAKLDN